MNKTTFIDELKRNLSHLPQSEIDDIVRDQEEYIRDATSAGRSEEDVVRSLGSPRAMAASFRAETKITNAQASRGFADQLRGTLGAVIAVLALAPLNLIIVLGPFLGLVGFLIGGWSIAGATLISGVALVAAFLFKLVFVSARIWVHLSLFFFTAGMIGGGVLLIVFMSYLTRWFFQGTLAYLKWNLKFIQARA